MIDFSKKKNKKVMVIVIVVVLVLAMFVPTAYNLISALF